MIKINGKLMYVLVVRVGGEVFWKGRDQLLIKTLLRVTKHVQISVCIKVANVTAFLCRRNFTAFQ